MRLKFERALLTNFDETLAAAEELRSCTDAHGRYSTLRFVLQLSPEVHRKLKTAPSGIHSNKTVSFEQVQAFSTYLHESIHWWQHIGSTAGLVLSLSHPVQTHSNFSHLKTFLKECGPKKSILKFNAIEPRGTSSLGLQTTNIIVNNYKDVGFYQSIALQPKSMLQFKDDPFFENVAHSYHITYANTLRQLTGLFDPSFTFLPDPRTWEPEFAKLRDDREEGFYHGSPIGIPPVGLKEIFEGQACFTQLQYLHFATGGQFEFEDAIEFGMLGEVYVAAFKSFLQLTEAEWPTTINSPIVALYMAVCDIAINAGAGFPLPLVHPHAFIVDNDPGTRFTYLSRLIALKAPHLRNHVTRYSREEYEHVTEEICKLMLTPSPLALAQKIAQWSRLHGPLITLMEEDRTFCFSKEDMPARLLFAKYLGFNRDKADHPEKLCWAGAWLAGNRVSIEGEALFNRNRALFVNREDEIGIFPLLLPDRDERAVQETFDSFYAWIVNYEMISQWIRRDGRFTYDYGWLSAHPSPEVKAWSDAGFEHVFGVHPDKFEIV